jgi:carbonic anhydrase
VHFNPSNAGPASASLPSPTPQWLRCSHQHGALCVARPFACPLEQRYRTHAASPPPVRWNHSPVAPSTSHSDTAVRTSRISISCRLQELLPTDTCSRHVEDEFTASLQANKIWASDIAAKDPEFFKNSAKGQTPDILWIGCCDSRVPETTVLGKKPGEVFVLRNIANVINPTDIALLSSVEFSVKHLKIKHIVLCGHTSCGGVKATLANNKLDILDVWLQPMRQIREKNAETLNSLSDADKEDALARLNVQQGVDNLRRIPTVVDAIKERGLKVHGLLYRLDSGHLEQVDTAEDEKASECRHNTFELK